MCNQSLFLLLSCIIPSVNAWKKVGLPQQRQPLWKQVQTKATGVALGTALVVSSSFPAQAFDPSVYNNNYDDPLHPMCLRRIEVNKSAPNSFHYAGTAVGSEGDKVLHGCSSKEIQEFTIRRTAFDGTINLDTGRISAGDGIHEGIWEPANSVSTKLGFEDVDGIRWNDGNKWTVKTKSFGSKAGEYIFLAYVGFSTLAGVKGVWDGIQRKRQEAST
mmetsp:Transcript_27513/g.41637  ORF Transcript_27513/g.41637 Transcript_27513/m.41637 type:complete len:217 (-) Transcript_27513:80-730(-)